jgi:solute carrier family 66, member 2
MATCPVLGYVMQIRLIHKNETVGAFSTDICLVLLVANILRLNFYPFKYFETALIFQSLFMITAQLVLLHACTQYSEILSNDDE